MHPSTIGRGVPGAPNSLNSNNTQGSSRSRPSSGQVGQPSLSDSGTASDLWLYSGGDKDTQRLASTSASSMIGPTSTFYNADDSSFSQDDQQYQQWLNSYGGQRQQQQTEFSSPFRRDALPAVATQQNVQNPYSYMQGSYSSSNSLSQYAGSTAGTVTQSNVGDLNPVGNTTYQTGDMYPAYFPDLLPVANSSSASSPEHGHSYPTSTPESTSHSYSNSPDPVYQQQIQHQQTFTQQQQHTQQPLQSHSKPNPPAQSSQFLQPPGRYLPPQRNPSSEHGTQASHSNPPSSHSSSLSPPPNTWSNEPVYSNKSQTTSTRPPQQQQFKVTSVVNANKAGPSRPNPTITTAPVRRTGGAPAVQASPPRASGSAAAQTGTKRKRARKNESTEWFSYGGEEASESESDDDDDGSGLAMTGGIGIGLGGLGVAGGKRKARSRLPGACTHCKKLKMKCDFPNYENTCKRCKSGGHVCIVEGRRPRTAPNKREYLLAQIRQKDAIIESLLKQLHNPYIATPLSIASYRMATSPSDQNNRNVLAWLDRLQSSVRDAGTKAGPRAFLDLRNVDRVEEESEADTENTLAKGDQMATLKKEAGNDGAEGALQDSEKLQSSLPDAHVPLGLLADLSLSNNKNRKKEHAKDVGINEDDLNDDNVGVANETYFMPGPATDLGIRASLIEQHSPPEILVHGLVKAEDVEKLFQIFYERVNPFISLLDPVLHTPASTFARCPFLFTVVCAIASRYYAEKSEIYPIAMHFAKHSAANALIDGWKSVELCQAYILMSIYAVPARRWEEDRSWLYTGLAIRIATDLNLHIVSTTKPQNENQEREILNKTRVWMICFNLDRSTATQFGKPSTIKEDFVVRNAKDWYKKSQYNLNLDLHLCGYLALLQIVAKFHEEIFNDPSAPTGLNKKVNFRTVTLAHNEHLTRYQDEWAQRFKEDSDPNDPACALRCSLLPFLVGYSRLVMFSFGFQQAYQRGFESEDAIFFTTCLESAKSVVENMIDGLAPSGYMRFAPDGHFVFASFASAFLLKLLRPEFSSFLIKEQENEIFDLIGRLIQTLSSPKIAIDDRHTPKLYARFLAGLLSRHRRDGATVGRLQTIPPPPSQLPDSSLQTTPTSNTMAGTSGPAGSEQGEQNLGQAQGQGAPMMETPIYMPEATFATSTGQIHFGSDYEMSFGGNGFSDEEMLATMQAIKNPAWWQNMMMPGFSWPEGSPSPPVNHNMITPSYLGNLHQPPAFGVFHGTQVML